MLAYVCDQARALNPAHTVLLASETVVQHPVIQKLLTPDMRIVVQPSPRGTGDGVRCGLGGLPPDFFNPPTSSTPLSSTSPPPPPPTVLVLFGDTPLLSHKTLTRLLVAHWDQGADLSVLAIRPPTPQGYGRVIVCPASGQITAIREEKDATETERALGLCNGGVMVLGPKSVALLPQLTSHNAAGEYYLTDLVALGHAQGLSVRHQEAPFEEVAGINTQRDLAHVAGLLQDQWRRDAMDKGVTLLDPASTYFSYDTHIDPNVTLYPHVFLDTGVRLQAGCVVYPFSVLANTTVKGGAKVGPFCHLRGGCVVDEGSTVGNFVEMKNTHLGVHASAKHLSYLGDATIGAQANIGAGTITCNYDGTHKHPTTIGARAFVGSNTALIAPVTICEGARIGAGSVITQDVPAHHLGLSRAPQENRPPRPSPPQRGDA